MKETSLKISQSPLPRIISVALALAVITGCALGFMGAWRAGRSRLLTFQGRTALLLPSAEKAVQEAPSDPEAHSGRAFVLLNSNELASAVAEFENAVSLRPRDYYLWLELGRARDIAGDEEGALAALGQAVKLAPEYAQPRWHFGNVLYRAGRMDEAFSELRRAALSDVTLLPNLIDLAWGTTEQDARATEELIQPQKPSWRIALAKFFARSGASAAAVAQFRAAGQFSDEDQRSLLNDLLAARRFKEAYDVWAVASGQSSSANTPQGIHEGGFESKLARDNPGFGWQLTRDAPALRVSLDRNNPRAGAQSLRLEFNGESNPVQPILTQLLLVEPNARYRLRFAARTEKLVTGGMPLIEISDASSKENRPLGQSAPLAQSSDEWQEYEVVFTTSNETEAVLVSLHRQVCSEVTCPVFGRIWLDDFRIEKV